MLKNQTNKLLSIINITKLLNTGLVMRQQTTQCKALVSLNIPLGSMHVTTNMVS